MDVEVINVNNNDVELNKNIKELGDKVKRCQKSMKTLKTVAQLLNPKAIGAIKREIIKSHNSCGDKVQRRIFRIDYQELNGSITLIGKSVEHCHRSHLNRYEQLITEMETLCNDITKQTENIEDDEKSKKIQEIIVQFKCIIEKEKLMKDEILINMCTHVWEKPLITNNCEDLKKFITALQHIMNTNTIDNPKIIPSVEIISKDIVDNDATISDDAIQVDHNKQED